MWEEERSVDDFHNALADMITDWLEDISIDDIIDVFDNQVILLEEQRFATVK